MSHLSFRRFPVVAAAGLLLIGAAPAAGQNPRPLREPPSLTLAEMLPGRYAFDKGHSSILFSYDHIGFSTAHGEFQAFEGELTFNPERPEASPVVVTIDPASVDVSHADLEGRLKGAAYFDVQRFPTIRFESRSLELTGPDAGVLIGALTIKDQTHPVRLDVRLNKFQKLGEARFHRLGFSATGVIKRSEWGLGAVPMIGDDVTLTIDAEFLKAGVE